MAQAGPPPLSTPPFIPAPTSTTVQPTATVTSSVSWVYQPPTAPVQTISALQTALAARTQFSSLPAPANLQFAPVSGTIPTIPAKFTTAAATGEFIDFNELLHAIDADSGEEPALCIQVAEGQHLTLPKKPKKRTISAFPEWVRCFTVYSSTLCAHQPHRGPDMLAYLYIISYAQQEFSFSACLAYDVAFRKKAAKFKLPSWGHIDPQLYAKAFTGASKGKPNAHCTLCLSTTHPTQDCSLYHAGPAKRARVTTAGPKRTAPLVGGKELCLNFNRGRCHSHDCPRAHVCSFRACGGSHPALHCNLRRSSPRKQ